MGCRHSGKTLRCLRSAARSCADCGQGESCSRRVRPRGRRGSPCACLGKSERAVFVSRRRAARNPQELRREPRRLGGPTPYDGHRRAAHAGACVCSLYAESSTSMGGFLEHPSFSSARITVRAMLHELFARHARAGRHRRELAHECQRVCRRFELAVAFMCVAESFAGRGQVSPQAQLLFWQRR